MKKLFLAICFMLLTQGFATAKVTEILDPGSVPQTQMPNPDTKPEVKQVTEEDLGEFLLDRLERTVIQEPEKLNSEAIYVEPSDDIREAEEEASKSMFQKIYEDALQRVSDEDALTNPERGDLATPGTISEESIIQQQQEWEVPDFPVVSALLPPDGQRVLVPAREHIPYLMSNIEILPDGMIKFNDTVVVVANGQKLKNGLSRMLPKYIYSRNRERQKIDYTLLKVTVNEQEIPYHKVERGDSVLLLPEDGYELEPGVYTYNFEYVNSNALWDYQDFREFYWDVTGSSWDLVVARAGATITLPPGVTPLGQESFIGYPKQLSADSINLLHQTPETWGYASQVPLFSGEGFHLIMSLPQDAIIPPTLTQKLLKLFDQYGEILISALGFAAILISFMISWKYIRANRGQLKFSLKKNGVMLRYLAHNRFDLVAVASFVLELYRKNIIDIQQAEDTVLLIRRTDNLSPLNALEKKAVGALFVNNEAVLNVNRANFLKIKRAAEFLERNLHSQLFRFIIKLNSGYLFFSIGMLLLTELFMAWLKINFTQTWITLAAGTLLMLGGGWLISNKWTRRFSKILGRGTGIVLTIAAFTAMSAVTTPLAVIFILFSVITILRYTTVYAQRNGLLKEQITEAKRLEDYLHNHREHILLGKEILSQQANIMALGLSSEFQAQDNQTEYNKLGAVERMIKNLMNTK